MIDHRPLVLDYRTPPAKVRPPLGVAIVALILLVVMTLVLAGSIVLILLIHGGVSTGHFRGTIGDAVVALVVAAGVASVSARSVLNSIAILRGRLTT